MSQKLQKKTLELVPVTKKDIKSFLITLFDYKFSDKDWKIHKVRDYDTSVSYYKLYNKDVPKSCLISVKIPSIYTTGKAIHLQVFFRDNIEKKLLSVYPSKSRTKGKNGYLSPPIYRNKYWKDKLHLEAVTGIDLCESLYESDSFIDTNTRHKIYQLAEQRYQLIEERFKNERKCVDLVQPNAILKCK